jgi:cytochrome c5
VRTRWPLLVALSAVTLLCACGRAAPPAAPAATTAAKAAPALPPGSNLGRLYAQTCANCHGKPGTGAPQAGNAADWDPRTEQGMDILVKHAVEGYKGMPPLGSCGDCSEDDFRALIKFMAGLPD